MVAGDDEPMNHVKHRIQYLIDATKGPFKNVATEKFQLALCAPFILVLTNGIYGAQIITDI